MIDRGNMLRFPIVMIYRASKVFSKQKTLFRFQKPKLRAILSYPRNICFVLTKQTWDNHVRLFLEVIQFWVKKWSKSSYRCHRIWPKRHILWFKQSTFSRIFSFQTFNASDLQFCLKRKVKKWNEMARRFARVYLM